MRLVLPSALSAALVASAVAAAAPTTGPAPVCRAPGLPTSPVVGPDPLADALGIPHCDGALTAYEQPTGGGASLFTFRVDPEMADGGFAPGCQAEPSRGYLGVRDPDGSVHELGRTAAPASPAVQQRGRLALVVAAGRVCGAESADVDQVMPLQRLALQRGAAGQVPGAALTLSGRAEPGSAALAASATGRLAVAWLEPRRSGGARTDQVVVRVGSLTGRIGAPLHPAGTAAVQETRLVWGTDDGLLLVTHEHDDAVVVRRLRADGRFGAAHRVGPARTTVQLGIGRGPGGRTALAYGTDASGEEIDSPWRVYATVLTPAAAPRARLLDPGVGRPSPTSDVAAHLGGDGIATFAWSSPRETHHEKPGGPVRYATATPAGVLGPVRTLAASSTGGVSLRDTGLSWTGPGGARRAVRPPGALTLGPPEPVAPPPAGGANPTVLVDPAIG